MRIIVVLLALIATGREAEAGMPPAGDARVAAADSAAAAEEALPYYRVPSVLVEAPRIQREAQEDPAFTDIITSFDLRKRRLARTVPEGLQETAGIMVQKTGRAQGSPILRGFTGFRTLLLVDGIRLNNSVFREGPNQYWSTVDPLSLARMEVVRGPSAVLQGSEAVGGVTSVTTRSWDEEGVSKLAAPSLYYRYSSADQAQVLRGQMAGRLNDNGGYVLGVSTKDFGDARGGSEVGRQRKTGYGELDGDLRLDYGVGRGWQVALSHQRDNQDDAWRTHKTVYGISWHGTTVGSDREYVLDQHRRLSYLQLRGVHPESAIREAIFSVSYHDQAEDTRRVRKDGRLENQGFDVGTVGVWGELKSPVLGGSATYGLDYYRDRVDSYSRKYDAEGALTGVGIQGPVADDATYDLAGAFLRVGVPLSPRLDAHVGGRFTYARVDAAKVQDPVTGEPFAVQDSWNKLVGSGRLAYHLGSDRHWILFTGVAQAFRAPNLSDLTRFDSARTNEFESPSPGVHPEDFLTFDVGAQCVTERFSMQASSYYSDIGNMIVRYRTGRMVDDEYEVTKRNSGDGFVTGVDFQSRYRLHPRLEPFVTLSSCYGEVDQDYLDRLPPLSGVLGMTWRDRTSRYWVEGSMYWSARQSRLSARDREDTDRIPAGGTPGFAVLNLRSGWEVSRRLAVSAAVENVTNVDYRIHGSGVNEPGVNFLVGLEVTPGSPFRR